MLLVLLACRPAATPEPLDQAAEPLLNASPAWLDFGSVPAGETVGRTLELANLGDADLHLLKLELDSDAWFSVSAPDAVVVPPEQATRVVVAFSPASDGGYSTHLWVHSDDGDPPLGVALSGVGRAPVLDLSPRDQDLGSVGVGCREDQPITLSNHGGEPLTVTHLEFASSSDELTFTADTDSNGPLPWTLVPNESAEVWLSYEPTTDTAAMASLVVESDDPTAPSVLASYNAQGSADAWVTDSFDVPQAQAVDVVLALDWSASMLDETADLLASFEVLLDGLDDNGMDYQLATVVEDDGCVVVPSGQPAFIDASQSRSQQLDNASWMICAGDSSSGCGSGARNSERAFMLLEAALRGENTDAGGCNQGLVREDADLVLVGISDEPEQSVNPYTYYVVLFQSMKSSSSQLVMHAVGGSPRMGSFELSEVPAPATLALSVDGVGIDDGWAYSEVDNTVDFSEPLAPGASVLARYAVAASCP